MIRSSRAFFSSGVSFAGGAFEGFGFDVGAAEVVSVSPEEAGTVVPDTELPEGALPVNAAWLSGVGRGRSRSGGGGSVPASSDALAETGDLSSADEVRASFASPVS